MGRRILVVDDEVDIRLVLTQILKSQGFEVDTAENGAEAYDKVNAGEYDLMVLDVMMPVMDGFELLEKLSPEVKERVPVVVLTAKASDRDVLKGYSTGASYYITKPFDNVSLLNAVLYMLGELTDEQMAEAELKL